MDGELVLRTWADVEEAERSFPSRQGDRPKWIYRGQANFCWRLEPSLLRLFSQLERIDPKDSAQLARAVAAEEAATKAFQMAHPMPADTREWIGWWAIAQHYGGATRVLDWTGRLGVAVYMAARSHLGKDGAVYMLNTARIARNCRLDNLRPTDEGWRQQQRILREGHPETIHWCRSTTPYIRLQVQEGWFTTCTNILREQGGLIEEQWPNALKKFRIPSDSKRCLLAEAALRGCSGSALFCDSTERAGYAQHESALLHFARQG